MRNIHTLSLGLVIFGIASVAHATVGGDKLINSFTYNPEDESVYYVSEDFGGRGCPPELRKLSLASGLYDIVVPCGDDAQTTQTAIRSITTDFKPLTPLDLRKNDIAIDLTFDRSEQYSPEVTEIVRSHFTATVYQHGKSISTFPVQGCSISQPFIFQGYSIPGYDKKIAMLVSAKGDCFEGGYIYETLYVVSGVSGLDKTAVTFYKGSTPLLPNEGNYVVYEHESPVTSNTSITPSTQNQYAQFVKPSWAPPAWIFGPVWTVLYVLIALSFGRVVFLFFKRQITFRVALPFVLNLCGNLLFTWIQFGLQNNILATINILLVLGTLVWAICAIWPYSRIVAYTQIPYLLWVSFATVLQITVTYLNY